MTAVAALVDQTFPVLSLTKSSPKLQALPLGIYFQAVHHHVIACQIHPSISSGGYSVDVRLRLRMKGELIPLAQIGPTQVILREPKALPIGPAEIIMHVDDAVERWTVDLGTAEPGSCSVPIKLLH